MQLFAKKERLEKRFDIARPRVSVEPIQKPKLGLLDILKDERGFIGIIIFFAYGAIAATAAGAIADKGRIWDNSKDFSSKKKPKDDWYISPEYFNTPKSPSWYLSGNTPKTINDWRHVSPSAVPPIYRTAEPKLSSKSVYTRMSEIKYMENFRKEGLEKMKHPIHVKDALAYEMRVNASPPGFVQISRGS